MVILWTSTINADTQAPGIVEYLVLLNYLCVWSKVFKNLRMIFSIAYLHEYFLHTASWNLAFGFFSTNRPTKWRTDRKTDQQTLLPIEAPSKSLKTSISNDGSKGQEKLSILMDLYQQYKYISLFLFLSLLLMYNMIVRRIMSKKIRMR